jgi:hypothetical protein
MFKLIIISFTIFTILNLVVQKKTQSRSISKLSTLNLKKILLLSDTHSHIDDTILKYVQQADEVWHAGDIGSLVAVSYTHLRAHETG